MAMVDDNLILALFCDFENIALGVRDAKYAKFDIKRVLERLLVKGSIVVKKAYCDWDRYKEFKEQMHEAAFELIEIPHVRQSGKNSADIRMVVDALDLCYTKAHVDTFVIISGDSDFSPLVSKLRENAKTVIGVGVKNSTSDLLIRNCDEFIFYDDLVREQDNSRRKRRRPAAKKAEPAVSDNAPPPEAPVLNSPTSTTIEPISSSEAVVATAAVPSKAKDEDRVQVAIDLVIETADAMHSARGEEGTLWGSMIKQALKRRRPEFNESYYGVRSFNKLLEEAQARGQLDLELDERSGGYIVRRIAHEE